MPTSKLIVGDNELINPTITFELSKSKNPLYRQIANIARNIKDLKIEVDDNKSETQAKKLEGASDTAKINIAILDALREAKRRVDAGEKLSTVGK